MAFKQNREAGSKLDSYEGMQSKGLIGGKPRKIINPDRQINKSYIVNNPRRANSTKSTLFNKQTPTWKFSGSKREFVESGARKQHIKNMFFKTINSSILPGVAIWTKKQLDSQI